MKMKMRYNLAAMATGVATGSLTAIIMNKVCEEADLDPCSNITVSVLSGVVVGTATGTAMLTTFQTREDIKTGIPTGECWS